MYENFYLLPGVVLEQLSRREVCVLIKSFHSKVACRRKIFSSASEPFWNDGVCLWALDGGAGGRICDDTTENVSQPLWISCKSQLHGRIGSLRVVLLWKCVQRQRKWEDEWDQRKRKSQAKNENKPKKYFWSFILLWGTNRGNYQGMYI